MEEVDIFIFATIISFVNAWLIILIYKVLTQVRLEYCPTAEMTADTLTTSTRPLGLQLLPIHQSRLLNLLSPKSYRLFLTPFLIMITKYIVLNRI